MTHIGWHRYDHIIWCLSVFYEAITYLLQTEGHYLLGAHQLCLPCSINIKLEIDILIRLIQIDGKCNMLQLNIQLPLAASADAQKAMEVLQSVLEIPFLLVCRGQCCQSLSFGIGWHSLCGSITCLVEDNVASTVSAKDRHDVLEWAKIYAECSWIRIRLHKASNIFLMWRINKQIKMSIKII